jgi:hypothetical protein
MGRNGKKEKIQILEHTNKEIKGLAHVNDHDHTPRVRQTNKDTL